MSIAKKIIIDELEEQCHPEKVEDVIFWALEYYCKDHKDTWGGTISYAIKQRILDAERENSEKNNYGRPAKN